MANIKFALISLAFFPELYEKNRIYLLLIVFLTKRYDNRERSKGGK